MGWIGVVWIKQSKGLFTGSKTWICISCRGTGRRNSRVVLSVRRPVLKVIERQKKRLILVGLLPADGDLCLTQKNSQIQKIFTDQATYPCHRIILCFVLYKSFSIYICVHAIRVVDLLALIHMPFIMLEWSKFKKELQIKPPTTLTQVWESVNVTLTYTYQFSATHLPATGSLGV